MKVQIKAEKIYNLQKKDARHITTLKITVVNQRDVLNAQASMKLEHA